MTCFHCIAASKGAGERVRPFSLKHAIRQAAKEYVTDVLRAPWWLLLGKSGFRCVGASVFKFVGHQGLSMQETTSTGV